MSAAGLIVFALFFILMIYMAKDVFVEQQAILWLKEYGARKLWYGRVGIDKKPDLNNRSSKNVLLVVNINRTPHMVVIFDIDRSFNLENDAVRAQIVKSLLDREGVTLQPIGFYTSEQSIFF